MNFRFEIVDRVARLTLDRPEAFNTMSPGFWRELDEVLERLQREVPARVLVIDSTGRHFSAGMSLEAFGSSISLDDSRAASRANIALLLMDMQRTFDRIAQLRMPVIVAIQGGCIGGGVDLVTLQRLPKLIPEGIARELAYTGRRLPAARALALGLVNDLFETQEAMIDEVMDVAREIATKPPVAVWASKQAIDYARDHSVADGLQQMGWLQSGLWDNEAVAEAIRARAEKRAPRFADLEPLRRFAESGEEGDAT